MQEKLNFSTFFDTHGEEFDEYLSKIGGETHLETRHQEIQAELAQLYTEYPRVKAVMDQGVPQDLSEEECAVLLKIYELKREVIDREMKEVYFKGCTDCAGYLKKIKLL